MVVATKVEVTPAQLRGAAAHMGELRDRVGAILLNLESSLATKGAPWGDDGYGQPFADGSGGQPGYLAARENLTTGLRNVRTTLDSYSDGQYRAATLLERQDRF